MRPSDIFKRGVGCLSLSMTFCIGLSIGYFIFTIREDHTPFIDQRTAAQYAIESAQHGCETESHPRPVNCAHYRVISFKETKDGWWFGLVSADGQRSITMFVKRKGEIEAEGPIDFDKPETWPTDKPPTRQDIAAAQLWS